MAMLAACNLQWSSRSTRIGFGSGKEGSHKVHGSPLGPEDLAAVKAKFGFDPEAKFAVPEEVRTPVRAALPCSMTAP